MLFDIIKATFEQSREARIQILRKMLTTIPRPKEEISEWAPRLIRTQIDPLKIGLLIGPGGKNIRGIQEATGTVIEVQDDGTVTIASTNREWAEAALAQVEACTATVQIGKIYTGRVVSLKDFGAFVEIIPGRDGLVQEGASVDRRGHGRASSGRRVGACPEDTAARACCQTVCRATPVVFRCGRTGSLLPANGGFHAGWCQAAISCPESDRFSGHAALTMHARLASGAASGQGE